MSDGLPADNSPMDADAYLIETSRAMSCESPAGDSPMDAEAADDLLGPPAADYNTSLPLLAAAADGDSEALIGLIFDGMKVNAVDCEGRTAVMHAAIGGHMQAMQLLLSQKADPTIQDSCGCSARDLALVYDQQLASEYLRLEVATGYVVQDETTSSVHRRTLLERLRPRTEKAEKISSCPVTPVLHNTPRLNTPRSLTPRRVSWSQSELEVHEFELISGERIYVRPRHERHRACCDIDDEAACSLQ